MERPNNSTFNSINDVEADDLSYQAHRFSQEVTFDTGRVFAGERENIPIADSAPVPGNPQVGLVSEQHPTQQPGLYQCSSGHGDDSGSGSDSAKEEDSPYGSTETPKHEMMVPSGKTEEFLRRNRSPPPAPSQSSSEMSYPPTTVPSITRQTATKQVSVVEESTGNLGNSMTVVTSRTVSNRMTDDYANIDVRLATFLRDTPVWPDDKPSPEVMAAAGMFFKGVYHLKNPDRIVYDMVECYKCGGRMHSFSRSDDPVEEHKKTHPNCH